METPNWDDIELARNRVDPVDWIELIELVHRFTWAIDQGEWHLIAAVLSDRVYLDSSTVTGQSATHSTRDEFLANLSAMMKFNGMQHIVGNHLVAVSDDRSHAQVRAYAHVTLVLPDGKQSIKRNGVCYRFRAQITPANRWEINAIQVLFVFDEASVPQLGVNETS